MKTKQSILNLKGGRSTRKSKMRLNQLKKILRNLKKCIVSLFSLTFLEAWPKPFTKKEAARFEAEDATWEEMFDSVITDDEEKQIDE